MKNASAKKTAPARRAGSPFVGAYLGFWLAGMYVPIVLTVLYSFNVSKITSVWGGWTLDWYAQLLGDGAIWEALRNSIVLGLSCSALAVGIGTAGALGLRDRHTPLSGAITYLSTLPIMIPEIILGMVFLGVFSFMALPFGMLTLILGHTSFCVPYVLMMVRARLAGMDRATEEAARDLGAGPLRTFWDVTLPAILPGILSGALLSFAMSFDDVVISIFVTGATTNTLAVKIYTKVKTGVTPEINALATLLLLATVAVVAGVALIRAKRERRTAPRGEPRR